jgi:NADH:ubiquinone oxidoreductase subunit 4 (subunit M)
VLIIFLISLIILLLVPYSFIAYVGVLTILYLYYLSNLNLFFNSSLSVNIDFFLHDEVSLFMRLLLFFIIFISYFSSRSLFKSHKVLGFVLLLLIFFCFEVFNTTHLFSLYFFYEASLIPILYIIIKWGSYPERSVSAMMIISYTLLFGVPMFMVIIILYFTNNTWLLCFYSNSQVSLLVRIFIFLCFAVKLPIYGLHYWLPIAHVEAPTFGSVILASILLKLGGVGLVRLLPILHLSDIKSVIISYFIIFTVFSTIVCCFQSDFKRLIAYSSVSHIIVIPFLILSRNILSIQSLILVMLLHGISSSLIFIRVGLLYNIFGSRQLVLLRGIALMSPLLSLILVLTFFYTLSAPPFPSYVAEVYFILSRYLLSPYIVVIYILFVFLGLVYNLNWLSAILFSSNTNTHYRSLNITYAAIIPFLIIMLITLFIIFLFFNI